jgi:hypothetical protein
MTDRRIPTDQRVLTDADIQAIVAAMAVHEDHCRFKTVKPDDLHDVMVTVRAFSSAMEEGKSVVRKTLIVLLIGGIVSLIGLGSTAKLGQLFKP